MGEEEEEGRWMEGEKWLWRPLPHLFPSEGETGMLPPSPLRLEGVEKSEFDVKDSRPEEEGLTQRSIRSEEKKETMENTYEIKTGRNAAVRLEGGGGRRKRKRNWRRVPGLWC